MNDIVNVHDLKTNYSKYLEQVIQGHEVLLGRYGKPVAKIVRLKPAKKDRQLGTLVGKIWISDDFNDPMPELYDQIANR